MEDIGKSLRKGDPVSNNLHNLIQTLNEKIDSVARYKIYIEDAQSEDSSSCVDLFRRLEEKDRRDVDELLQHVSDELKALGIQSRGERAA